MTFETSRTRVILSVCMFVVGLKENRMDNHQFWGSLANDASVFLFQKEPTKVVLGWLTKLQQSFVWKGSPDSSSVIESTCLVGRRFFCLINPGL